MEMLSLREMIARHVAPGQTLALEGFTHLIPFAAGQEIIRQRIGDLHLVRMTPDIIYDQMIGCGLVRELTFSWGGNPGVGSLHRLRDAIENGWPQPLAWNEHSHAGMAAAYCAGAARLPFGTLRGYLGTDLPQHNAQIRSVTCPYTGEQLATVRALNPDVTILHAQQVDRAGNVLIRGILGAAREAAMAATRVLVTVEEQVEKLAAPMNATVLPHWIITAVAPVRGGAWPSYAQGYYPRDNAFYQDWDAIARERDGFSAWMQQHVFGTADHRQFLLRLRAGRGE
ncbi:MAG: CoA transferase subunit A [Gammaproteobacteria bacterium]|jgi:glutaconate CoA-transferase subunit A|nr:CoA transferase subunit A [Gammaproteobacteria bacterium]MBP6052602.1 CoA transferase subunit A [Pseudomonadales bacterium]MBK6582108.1 CoA transferase subunit A [Gammaproteobacteria bacterium]MBK7521618.1 CoA transferase subunit A [Gammaproteobacteria bacterium]MBK7729392.1 CoA transferase subunit A [Gammaproteobacteria bacterium]